VIWSLICSLNAVDWGDAGRPNRVAAIELRLCERGYGFLDPDEGSVRVLLGPPDAHQPAADVAADPLRKRVKVVVEVALVEQVVIAGKPHVEAEGERAGQPFAARAEQVVDHIEVLLSRCCRGWSFWSQLSSCGSTGSSNGGPLGFANTASVGQEASIAVMPCGAALTMAGTVGAAAMPLTALSCILVAAGRPPGRHQEQPLPLHIFGTTFLHQP